MPSKGSTGARGYGHTHQRLRAKWAPKVKTGQVNCWRCGNPIQPGQAWDLGHDDHDRTQYRGPEHAHTNDCTAGGNRATANRRTKPKALNFFTPTDQHT